MIGDPKWSYLMNITNFPENESELFSRKNRGPTTKTLKMSLKKSHSSIILVPFCVFSPIKHPDPSCQCLLWVSKIKHQVSTSPLLLEGPKKVMTSKALRPITGASTHAVGKNGPTIGLRALCQAASECRTSSASAELWGVVGVGSNFLGNFPHSQLTMKGNPGRNDWKWFLGKGCEREGVPKVWWNHLRQKAP